MAPAFKIAHLQLRCSASRSRSHIRSHASLAALALRVVSAGLMLSAGSATHANEAAVVSATALCDSARVCSFDVTVLHEDAGWDHYANAWRVIAVDGAAAETELGKRVLHHPHDNEQPFTRSLSGVSIPEDTTQVDIEALDSVHESGGQTFRLNVPDGTPAN